MLKWVWKPKPIMVLLAGVVTVILLVMGHWLGLIYPFSRTPSLSLQNIRVLLTSVSPQNRFVVYRMVSSERQDPDGFRLNDNGEERPDGKYVVDYIGVVEVEAGLEIDKVNLTVNEEAIEVNLPAIQLDPVINYRLSFPWKESRLPNHVVPAVMELIRKRAAEHAIERGVLQEAQEAAQQWFQAFLRPVAGGKEVIVTQADMPLQALQ